MKNKSIELDNLTRRFYLTNSEHQRLLNEIISVNGNLLKKKRDIVRSIRGDSRVGKRRSSQKENMRKHAQREESEYTSRKEQDTRGKPAKVESLDDSTNAILSDWNKFKRLISLSNNEESEIRPELASKSPIIQAHLASHFGYKQKDTETGRKIKKKTANESQKEESSASESSGSNSSSESESSYSSRADTFSEDSEEGKN